LKLKLDCKYQNKSKDCFMNMQENATWNTAKTIGSLLFCAMAISSCGQPTSSTPTRENKADGQVSNLPATQIPTVPSPTTASAEPAFSEGNIQAVKSILAKEPKVKDVLYDPNLVVQWQVGVLTDGSSRVGYAQYICELLKEGKVLESDTQVRVVDIVRVSSGTGFREASLGRVDCSSYKEIAE
jgi:hypothetical protein